MYHGDILRRGFHVIGKEHESPIGLLVVIFDSAQFTGVGLGCLLTGEPAYLVTAYARRPLGLGGVHPRELEVGLCPDEEVCAA